MPICVMCGRTVCECICSVCGSDYRIQAAHVGPKSKTHGLLKKGFLNLFPLCYHHHQLMDTHIRTKGDQPSCIGIDLDNEEFIVQTESMGIVFDKFKVPLLLDQDLVNEHNTKTAFKIQWILENREICELK